MKAFRLSWQAQTIFSLFLGLLMGWLLTPQASPAPETPPAWLVNLRFQPDAAPQFISVSPSRLRPALPTTPKASDNAVLELQDAQGKPLWSLSFWVSFDLDDLPSPVPYRLLSFIIPALPQAARLHISAPGGEASYELP